MTQLLSQHIIANGPLLSEIVTRDYVDRHVNFLTVVIKNGIDGSAPFKTKTIRRPTVPWINGNIKRDINDRNNTQKAFKINILDTTLQVEYKQEEKCESTPPLCENLLF